MSFRNHVISRVKQEAPVEDVPVVEQSEEETVVKEAPKPKRTRKRRATKSAANSE